MHLREKAYVSQKTYISFLSLPADCDAYKMIKSNDVIPFGVGSI